MKNRFRQSLESKKPNNVENDLINQTSFDDDYMSMVIPDDNNITKKSTRGLSQEPLKGKKKINEMMTESITQSMSQPLSNSSKGFKLLQKLGGYSGEHGLGKSSQGIQEPLKVELPEIDRAGIGSFQVPPSLIKKRKKSEHESILIDMSKNYRSHVSETVQNKKVLKDLKMAELTIYDLDSKHSIEFNILWPKSILDFQNKSDEDTKKIDIKKIKISDHNDDDEDDNSDIKVNLSSTTENEDKEVKDNINHSDRLLECLNYLRNTYNYCLFCGCQYSDNDELLNQCPGLLSEDH